MSYLSEASALLAGLDVGRVTRPEFIEIPRSLVEVVIYWNIPMHHWLKTCKFIHLYDNYVSKKCHIFHYILNIIIILWVHHLKEDRL